MFPRECKNWYLQNSVQIFSKCSRELARCHVTRQRRSVNTSTETHCNRKAPSLSSPEVEEIFRPRLAKSWNADVFRGPKALTAIVLTTDVGILFLYAKSGKLCCSTCLSRGPSDVGLTKAPYYYYYVCDRRLPSHPKLPAPHARRQTIPLGDEDVASSAWTACLWRRRVSAFRSRVEPATRCQRNTGRQRTQRCTFTAWPAIDVITQ